MKNLKRLLCLALTGVMLSGMMVMGASAADFTDADEIVNTEAVDTMVALNIINGKDDGSYDPNGLVTRGEMAKMIAVAMNGGIAPEFGTKVTPTYTDIKGHWAEQYIEYCSDMKIVSGRGDGTFDPAGNVTGTEAAKMMLTALGYDATAFQLTGADWALNVAYEATWDCKPSLYEDLQGTNMNVAITRDTAAQLIWNGVQNVIMTKTPDKSLATGEVTYNYQLASNLGGKGTLLYNKYGATIDTAVFNGNYATGAAARPGQIDVGGVDIPYDLDISLIGEKVKVVWKDLKNTTPDTMDAKDKFYGVFPTGETHVITATLNDISKTYTTAGKIKVAGVEYTVAATTVNNEVVVTRNLGAGAAATTDTVTTAGTSMKAAFQALSSSQNGDKVKFVCDSNGDIDHAYVTASTLNYVTAVNATKVSIQGVGAIDIDGNEIYDGIAKNDVVVVTKLYGTDKEHYIVEQAETIEGTVDGYKGTENVVVDGTTCKIWKESGFMPTTLGDQTGVAAIATGHIGKEFTFYTINGYVAAAVQSSDDLKDLALVIDANDGKLGSTFNVPQAQFLLADGTKVTKNIHKDSIIKPESGGTTSYQNDGTALVKDGSAAISNGSGGGALQVGQLVKYTAVDDSTFKIEEVGTYDKTAAASAKVYDSKLKTFNAGGVVGGDCILFAKVGTDYKVYHLRDLGDVSLASTGITANTTYSNAYYAPDGKVVAAFAVLGARPSGASSNTMYGIVASDIGVIKVDGVAYNKYTVVNNEEEATVLILEDENTLSAGQIVSFEKVSDDIYTFDGTNDDITVYNGLSSYSGWSTDGATKGMATWVKEYSEADKTISFYKTLSGSASTGFTGAGPETLALDDKCQIVYVDAYNNKAGTDIGINSYDGVTGYRNVMLVKDSSTTNIIAIVVESSLKDHIIVTGASGLVANTTNTTLKSASTADGVYTPADDKWLPAGRTWDTDMPGVAYKDVRIFKFTSGSTANNGWLVIKNSAGQTVYADYAANSTSTAYAYYISLKPLHGGNDTGIKSPWVAGSEAQKGTYSWAVINSTETIYSATVDGGTVLAEGFFTY